VIEKPWELIPCLLASTKYNLVDVCKAIIRGFSTT
jgi:hypothetical protein